MVCKEGTTLQLGSIESSRIIDVQMRREPLPLHFCDAPECKHFTKTANFVNLCVCVCVSDIHEYREIVVYMLSVEIKHYLIQKKNGLLCPRKPLLSGKHVEQYARMKSPSKCRWTLMKELCILSSWSSQSTEWSALHVLPLLASRAW